MIIKKNIQILFCVLNIYIICNAQRLIEYTVDTSIYEFPALLSVFYPEPQETFSSEGYPSDGPKLVCYLYRKKNSDVYTIFSIGGTTGDIIIHDKYKADFNNRFLFSKKYIDNDEGWECIIVDGYTDVFYVIDDDGTELLSEAGNAMYGFDGNCTYVVPGMLPMHTFKAWRFRENITSSSFSNLSKKNTLGQKAIMTFEYSGDLKVSLNPLGGGKTSLEIFDMMGRRSYQKVFNAITSKTTFTVKELHVPKSPFIAKTTDENGSVVEKKLRVK